MPGLEPLSDAVERLPAGVFLQPSYTWTRIESDGSLAVGVHPLLLGLVGAPYALDLLPPGERFEKGAPFVRLGHGERRLTVSAPVSGRITAVNHAVAGETDWSGLDNGNGGAWLYRVEPEAMAPEVERWMIADRATAWTREQLARVREHLARRAQDLGVGVAMADGGEVPTGILAELDDRAWTEFEDAFLRT